MEITNACRKFGASTVHRAAFDALNGRRAALLAMGLPATLADANRIMGLAFDMLSPEDRAGDLADVTIALARLPGTGKAPPDDGDLD